jgi:PKD repeat protein
VPIASFTYTPAYPDVGQAVQFSELSTGGATSWFWDFNDGSTSSDRNPSHAFSTAGTYNVSLSVSGPAGSQSCSRRVLIGSGNNTAGTYWVSPTGTVAWQNARSDTPLSGAACCSLRTANTNATAGDTICLRGGTYTTSLAPAHSGTKENRIVFQAYGGEIPLFTVTEAGGRWAIKLQGCGYIKVDGITSSNSGAFFFIGYGACYNEITNCAFDRSSADYQLGYITDWNSARNAKAGTRHNWLHHNSFSRYGAIDYLTGEDLGTIRISSNYDDTTSHNTFEDNVFSYGGHDCIDIGGQFNVIRNNVFHNEGAYFKDLTKRFDNVPSSGYFGNRNILLSNSGENPGTAFHTLIEGNRIGYAGTPPDDDGSTGIENAGCHTLVRYNDIYGNGGMGYYSKMQPEGGQNTNLKSGSWGRVYHNTIYHGGYGDASIYGNQFKHGVCIWSYAAFDDWPTNVVVKNNIVYDNFQEWRVGSSNILPQVTYANNFNANPAFVNPDMSDKSSLVLPDLRLAAGSLCIDTGAPLTQAKGSGSDSLTLVADDAFLFQDGTWGSALTHGVTHFPDWIAVGTVENSVRIAAIDYATKTITLASPLTWTDGAKIWLYSDSGGRRVLKGSAPDIGAHEIDQ